MLKELAKLSYRFFGGVAFRHRGEFGWLREELKRARLPYSVEEYLSLIAFLDIVALAVTLLLSLFAFTAVLHFPLPISLLLAAVTAVGAAALLTVYMFNYPAIRSVARASEIDALLPTAITHMATLAGADIPPHHIFRIMGKIEKEMSVK